MRRLLPAVTALLAAAVLAGCTGSGDESGTADSGGSVSMPASPGGPVETPGEPADIEPDRQVVTTASVVLAVEDPADDAQRVSELVESAGGRVDERTTQAASGDGEFEGASADLVVRVPAGELTGVLADLEDLGDVVTVSVSRSDVTATAVDLDARIAALQTSVARLQALMDGAATTEALLAAEAALSDRQADLESLQSRRALLADQVELTTLSVRLQTPGLAPAGGSDGFLDGLVTGWRALVAALGTTLVVLGFLLPWAAVSAVAAAGVLLAVRTARRRAAASAPAPAGDDETPVLTSAGPG